MRKCICGCGRSGHQRHHVVYAQHLERGDRKDKRNLVPVHFECHAKHHARQKPFALHMLPDSVFAFAVEKLEMGPAYEYLRRRYAGDDSRLLDLLDELVAGSVRYSAVPLDPTGFMQARQARR